MAGAISSGGRNNWITQRSFVTNIEAWFGVFDLDVCADASSTKAPRFYDERMNSLLQPWDGNCWMNPPWASDLMEPFIDKAIRETRKPTCKVAALIPSKLEQPLWRKVWRNADVIFDIESRMVFIDPETGELATSGVTTPTSLVIFDRQLGIPPRLGRITNDGHVVGFDGELVHVPRQQLRLM